METAACGSWVLVALCNWTDKYVPCPSDSAPFSPILSLMSHSDLPFTPPHLTLALRPILPYSRLDTYSIVFNRIKDTTASLASLLRPLHPPHDEGRPLSLHVLDFWNSAYEDIDVDLVRHPKQVHDQHIFIHI